jgi:hypothetical protein
MMNQHFKIIKATINSLIIGLLIVLFPITLKAQLFEENELYPKVSVIIGKYHNGSGGKGYWSKEYVDSIGRVIIKESYRKGQLMSRKNIVYDKNNNILFDIQTFDYNNPERVDTFRYEYKYEDKRIVFQYRKLSDNDSTVIKVIVNQGDTLFKYQENAFYYRPKTNVTDVFETNYTLRYRNDQLISKEKFSNVENTTEIEKYEYYEYGRLKRRLIVRIPQPEYESFYVGGPGSDDEYYKYKLDAVGRIKVHYRIVNGKKFKIAVYRYV